MPEQLPLAEVDVSSAPKHRLFIGIFPDAAAASQIERLVHELAEQHQLGGKPLETDRFHVTLYHIGDFRDFPDGLAAAAKAAAASLTLRAFQVTFDRVMSFAGRPGNHPFVLRGGDGLIGLKALQESLLEALRHSGIGVGAKPSNPHVTLLYDDHRVVEQIVEPVSWTVHQLVLVHSELGMTRYHWLDQWSLRS